MPFPRKLRYLMHGIWRKVWSHLFVDKIEVVGCLPGVPGIHILPVLLQWHNEGIPINNHDKAIIQKSCQMLKIPEKGHEDVEQNNSVTEYLVIPIFFPNWHPTQPQPILYNIIITDLAGLFTLWIDTCREACAQLRQRKCSRRCACHTYGDVYACAWVGLPLFANKERPQNFCLFWWSKYSNVIWKIMLFKKKRKLV